MSLFSSTATSTSSIPQQVAANYNTAVTNAGAAASQPWQQYSADPNAFVAGLNTTQQAGIANTNASAGQAQPYFNAAQSALGAGVNQAMPFVYGGGQDVNAQQIGGQQIGQFMSPYLGSVYSAMLAGQGQQNAQQQSNLKSGAIGAGAFGGDRAGIGQANLAYQQNLANAQTNANMLNTGYGQALGAAQQQQGVNLGAQQANRAAQAATGQSLYGMGMGTSQQLGALGTGAQTAGLQGAAAQMGAGAAQQKTSQDALTAMYNQFLQSQAYPFQTSQFYTNAVTSLGPLFGGTTTTQTPGLFAARGGSIRGAYAGGGLIPSSMGGGVGYEHAGEGYADGGMPGGWSDYFQNALGASGFSPPTTYTPAPNQGGYTQAPGQSAYTQTQHPVYSQAPSGLGAAAAADYGNIFGNLSHNTAAPSAQQQYSDSQLPNIARLRSPLVHAPEVKKDDTANPVAAPSGLAGMPYAGTSESGVGGAGQNMGANAPHGGTGSFMGDVTGMRNALGDFFSGGTGWGGNGATINASMQTQDKSVYDAMDKAAAEPAGSQVEPGSQGDSGYGGAGDHEARGGRIHRAYGGLNLSTADLANMQAMQTENSGLFPGAPQGYKPPVDKRMQPGLGHASIPQQWHISQVRFPRPAAPSSSSNTVGGLINDFSGAKDFYNNVSGDNPDYLNAAKTASSALGLATGGTADRGHYSTAGGVYSSEGRESAIPGYSPELGIPDVLTPPQQRASNAPASSGGGGGGGLGDVLKIAGAVLPFLLKRGGAVGERHEYADGGLAGGRHGYAVGGGGPDEDTLAQPNGPFDFSQGMTNQPVGAKIKRAISAIFAPTSPVSAAPPAFMPAPEKPIGEVIPPIHSISQDDLNAYLESVGSRAHPYPNFLSGLMPASRPGSPRYSAQNPETLRYSPEVIGDEIARRLAYPAGSSNTTGNDIMQMGEGSEENTPLLPSSLHKISSYQQQFSKPRQIIDGNGETPSLVPGLAPQSNAEGNAPFVEENPRVVGAPRGTDAVDALIANEPPASTAQLRPAPSATSATPTTSGLAGGTTSATPTTSGLAGGTTSATPTTAVTPSAATATTPAAGLSPESGLGPYQQERTKPLNWFQRNQDLIGMVGGGLEGIGRGKNALGALLGGIGGAARGYASGERGMSALANQEMTTQTGPQKLAIESRTQDQQLLQMLLTRRLGLSQAGDTPETQGLDSQIQGLINRLGQQALPGGAPSGGPGPRAGDVPFTLGEDKGGPSSGYAVNTIRLESNGSPDKNPSSSAAGQGQFMNKTWIDLMRRHSPLASGKTDAEILAMRQDPQVGPALNVDMINAYARDNTPILRAAGIPVNDQTLRLMHAFGPGDAPRFIATAAQSPNTPMENLFPPTSNGLVNPVLAANPAYAGKTAGQVANMLVRGGASAVAAGPAAAPAAAPAAGPAAAPPATPPAEGALRTIPSDLDAAKELSDFIKANPGAIAYLHSAQSAGYNPANDPEQLIAKGNKAASTGKSAEAIQLWGQAREEINRLATQGQFVDAKGNMQSVPGWLDIQNARLKMPENNKYFDEQAALQTDRSKRSSALDTMGHVLQNNSTGALSGVYGDIAGVLRGVGINSGALSGIRAANEILQKEAILAGSSFSKLGLNAGATDYQTALQGKTTVDSKNEPEANQLILAQGKAAQIYENMYLKDELKAASLTPSFNRAAFASAWEAQHPGLLHKLTQEQTLTTPVRGIPRNARAPIGAQFVAEPNTVPDRTGKLIPHPVIVQRTGTGFSYVRDVE